MLRAVVICPGRGSYTAREHGTIERLSHEHGWAERATILGQADELRRRGGRPTISGLDGADFAPAQQLAGEHASALIFTLSALDLALVRGLSLCVVGVLGNSMGWYTALYAAGALDFASTFELVETMGAYQTAGKHGGQLLYPVVDESWRPDPQARAALDDALARVRERGHAAHPSIHLGGYEVLAADAGGLEDLSRELPPRTLGGNRYPLRLAGHDAFHSPLMAGMSEHGLARLEILSLGEPRAGVSLIDGRGCIWRARSTDPGALLRYTLATQVLEPYDFSSALRVALRELAPEVLILLGPGGGLGGAIGQVLCAEGWQGLREKADFQRRQAGERPLLYALGLEEQRRRLLDLSPT